MLKFLKAITAILLISTSAFSQKSIERNFRQEFEKYGVDGCFVLYNPEKDLYIRYNPALCDSGYLPASTFKIPNSIIALEEGIVKDADEQIKWDGHEWPTQSWNQDQTLRSAIKYSCVWVYIGFAQKIGIEKYQEYLDAFNYGNKNPDGPADRFWLAGNFKITANQQIDFLKKLYYKNLPVSERSMNIVKDIIILDKNDDYTLSGKTGGGELGEGKYIMWLVGYVEVKDKPCFYAMNFVTDNFSQSRQIRYDIVKEILKKLEVIN
ncbi:MAG: class D beta-lactamase [Bacteroidales bacterium]|nr:class D beta-lactamase [Bacteroidales bacterium]